MRHAGSCHARLWQLVRQVRPRMLDVAPSGPSEATGVPGLGPVAVRQTVMSPFVLMEFLLPSAERVGTTRTRTADRAGNSTVSERNGRRDCRFVHQARTLEHPPRQ